MRIFNLKYDVSTGLTPWFTLLLVFFCLGIYFIINIISDFGIIDDHVYAVLGAPYAFDIYRGQFWGVITNSFIHVVWYQLIPNLLLLYLFGRYIEKNIGPWRLFWFGLIASTISSCFQLGFSDDAGLGLSGVNYSLFGFLLVRSKIDKRFENFPYITYSVVMTGILILCFSLNIFGGWNFGMASLISGFLWGILVALLPIPKYRMFTIPTLSITLLFCIIGLIYAPWSAEWHFARGISYHEAGNMKIAQDCYKNCLELNPNHSLSKENLKLIKIDSLSEMAYTAHQSGQYRKAKRTYLRILKLDPKNKWARQNLKNLR